MTRARLKRKLAHDLSGLPRSAQQEILIALLAELEEEDEAPAERAPEQANSIGTSVRVTAEVNEPELAGADDRPEEGTYRKAIIDYLAEHPGAPASDLATLVYGESSKLTIGRIRSNLTALNRKGVIRNAGFGKWVVRKVKE